MRMTTGEVKRARDHFGAIENEGEPQGRATEDDADAYAGLRDPKQGSSERRTSHSI